MKPEAALLLLKSLLARLDADARAERPQLLGLVSDDERDALRLLLDDQADSEHRPPTEPERRLPRPDATTTVPSAVELNTDALGFSESPAPGWTLCLDFGTAKSKAFAASDEAEPELVPLAIGNADDDLDRAVHEVISSIWIDDDGLLFTGSLAVRRSVEYGDPSANRHRLDSLKQEISQVHPEDGVAPLRSPLPKEVDPTSTLTYEDAITVYLAYLTDLATTELESNKKVGTRYVRRRFTLPWWTDEQRKWAGDLLTLVLRRAQLLADTYRGRWRRGIHVSEFKRALAAAATHDERLAWMVPPQPENPVLEALAAASARLWNDSSARELMLVVDVGAGTTDLSLFWVVQSEGKFHRAWPIMPCGAAIKQAGDTLDSLLVKELLRKAELGADRGEERRAKDGLSRRRVRRVKEALFEVRTVTEQLATDHTVTLRLDEFLELDGIKTFEKRISDEIQGLLDRVHDSWEPAAGDRGITLVLTGGGSQLPMIQNLRNKPWKLGMRTVRCRLAASVPDDVADKFSDEFIQEYPKLAVAMGGALPMRLDERDALNEWMGGSPAPGTLEAFPTKGV